MPRICAPFGPNTAKNRAPGCSYMRVPCSNGSRPMCSPHLGGACCDSEGLVNRRQSPRVGGSIPPLATTNKKFRAVRVGDSAPLVWRPFSVAVIVVMITLGSASAARAAAPAPVEYGIDRSNMGTQWTLSFPQEPNVSPFLSAEYNKPGNFEVRRVTVMDGIAR